MIVKLHRVLYPVTALGPGRRLGVWFQGCTIGCLGCMSRDSWDSAAGSALPVTRLVGLWQDALARGATGLTISGGEPSEQPEALAAFLTAARESIDTSEQVDEPDRADILLYTGLSFDELIARVPAAALADAVITEPYDAGRPTTLIWRGSDNQQLRLLTDLARARYESYVDYSPDHPPMQVIVDDDTLRYVGVPRRGDLSRMEHDLRDAGITARSASWRP